MIPTEKKIKARHREREYFKRPRSTQDLIPVDAVYPSRALPYSGLSWTHTNIRNQ